MNRSLQKSALIVALCVFAIPFSAADAEGPAGEMSPTVKIVASEFTRNGGVVPQASGSATFISSGGLILTNNHVVEKDTDETYDLFHICISFNNQEEPLCEYTASLISRNRDMDVALLMLSPEDIRGNLVPEVRYYDYSYSGSLAEGDEIIIHGYPGIGKETITSTKGQVSGFEKQNGFTYIKTDTVISFGNSGGTALDRDGNLVGVPTFGISSSINSLAYFLDIREAKSWIDSEKIKAPVSNPAAEGELREYLSFTNDVKETGKYDHPGSPGFSITLPETWEFDEIDEFSVGMRPRSDIFNFRISISIQDYPFPVTKDFILSSILEDFEKQKEDLKNYAREDIDFHGTEAFSITYLYWDTQSTFILVPYGGSLIILYYEYALNEEDDAKAMYGDVLGTFTFTGTKVIPDPPESLVREDPPFSINAAQGWSLLENRDPRSEDHIVDFLREDDHEATISLYYSELQESDKKITPEDYLKEVLNNYSYVSGFRLIQKNASVIIDGIPGISLTYVYDGDDVGVARETSIVHLLDGEYIYAFEYDDLEKNFEDRTGDFETMLLSFKNLSTAPNYPSGEYTLGSLEEIFSDIAYHRYEQAIAELKDEGILDGYRDHTFRPERSVTRAEALKTMMLAKLKGDEKRNLTGFRDEIEACGSEDMAGFDFPDTTELEWLRKYLRCARKDGFVSGYGDSLFHPHEKITIAETLKILFGIYDIPVWDPEALLYTHTIPWYKPYMDKGLEMGIVPSGIDTADHILTRGELAFIIAGIYGR